MAHTEKRQTYGNYYSRHPPENVFYRDLTKAIVNSNIPFRKLENPTFRKFLEKWCERAAPSESTPRKQYLKADFENSARQAQEALVQHDIYFVVDETIDSKSRSIIAIIAKTLCETGFNIPYLIEVAELEKTDNSTVTQLIITTLAKLYGSDIQYDQLRLLVSDAAAYMIKVGKKLKNSFTQMSHVTCLAHGFKQVSEFVRIGNPETHIFCDRNEKILQKF